MKKVFKIILYIFIGIIALGIIGTIVGGDSSSTKTVARTETETRTAPADPRPESQQLFEGIIEDYYEQFDNAENEIQESQARRARMQAIAALPIGRVVEGWYGTLENMGTNSEGDAYIAISLNRRLAIKTWNNAFSDMSDSTLIKSTNPLYEKLGNMKKGQKVIFSGSFLPSDADTFREGSMTIDGAMTDPEFIFRFSDVNPVQ